MATSAWDCVVPPWRHDVLGEADLVEEVLRTNADNVLLPGVWEIPFMGGSTKVVCSSCIEAAKFFAVSAIKTHCFATFESEADASTTFAAIVLISVSAAQLLTSTWSLVATSRVAG